MFPTIQDRGWNLTEADCSSISPSSKRAVNKRFNEISISFSSIKPALQHPVKHIHSTFKVCTCPHSTSRGVFFIRVESHAFTGSIEIGNRSQIRDYNAFVSIHPAIFASTGDYCHNKALLKNDYRHTSLPLHALSVPKSLKAGR